jgi:hypothetical protein
LFRTSVTCRIRRGLIWVGLIGRIFVVAMVYPLYFVDMIHQLVFL